MENEITYKTSPIINRIFDIVLHEMMDNRPYGARGSIMTEHEFSFHLICPNMHYQKSFGTGKDGLRKYGRKSIVVDFYDDNNKVAYEIDGKSHEKLKTQIADCQKTICLLELYGIQTIRITNEYLDKHTGKVLKSL